MSYYTRVKLSLYACTCISCSVCTSSEAERANVFLIASVNRSSITLLGFMRLGYSEILCGELAGRHNVSHVILRALPDNYHCLDNPLRGKLFANEANWCQVLTDVFVTKTPDIYCQTIGKIKTSFQTFWDTDRYYFGD